MKLENHTAYLGMKTPLVSFKDKKPTDALTSNKKRMLRFGKKKALFLSIYFITIIIFMVMKLLLSLPQLLATEKKLHRNYINTKHESVSYIPSHFKLFFDISNVFAQIREASSAIDNGMSFKKRTRSFHFSTLYKEERQNIRLSCCHLNISLMTPYFKVCLWFLV